MKKLISILIALGLLVNSAPTVSAKQIGDWDNVKGLTKQIAVKTKRGATHYGLVDTVDDDTITIQIAGRDEMTFQKITIKREDVARVWHARLRFDEDNVTKATWMGAGAGLAVVGGVIAASNEAEDAPAGAVYIVMIGAGAGALLGKFWKKKHKKLNLVYSI
jgi:hypothetical protein